MSIILSLSKTKDDVWAAGPEGLFRVDEQGSLDPIPQPQENLYCCCAIHDRILVGGLPHGVAFSLEAGANWQAGWMDNVEAPVITMAADPNVEQSGIILAGTDGGGILRTVNRGSHWYTRNYGLLNYTVLAIVWAPPAPVENWPRWQMVFACTEEGVYHSPNGGRGWKRSDGPRSVYQTLAVDWNFHQTGVVLAGTESSGLYRSSDGGHSFEPVANSPQQVNALASTTHGWFLSDDQSVWHSSDGLQWEAISGTQPALVFLVSSDEILAGNESGLNTLEPVASVQTA